MLDFMGLKLLFLLMFIHVFQELTIILCFTDFVNQKFHGLGRIQIVDDFTQKPDPL